MLEVLYATGLRVCRNWVGLTMSDISLRRGVVRVIGKGVRAVGAVRRRGDIYWLETYLEHGRHGFQWHVSIDVLFPSRVRSG